MSSSSESVGENLNSPQLLHSSPVARSYPDVLRAVDTLGNGRRTKPGDVMEIYCAGISEPSAIISIMGLHSEINTRAAYGRHSRSPENYALAGAAYADSWYRLFDLLIAFARTDGESHDNALAELRKVVDIVSEDPDAFNSSSGFCERILRHLDPTQGCD